MCVCVCVGAGVLKLAYLCVCAASFSFGVDGGYRGLYSGVMWRNVAYKGDPS